MGHVWRGGTPQLLRRLARYPNCPLRHHSFSLLLLTPVLSSPSRILFLTFPHPRLTGQWSVHLSQPPFLSISFPSPHFQPLSLSQQTPALPCGPALYFLPSSCTCPSSSPRPIFSHPSYLTLRSSVRPSVTQCAMGGAGSRSQQGSSVCCCH